MNIESIVTNLELSQKLDEIGIKQESLFCWARDKKSRPTDEWLISENHNESAAFVFDYERLQAFTAQELWGMIEWKDLGKIELTKCFYSDYSLTWAKSFHKLFESDYDSETDNNIANCLAQLIIAQYEALPVRTIKDAPCVGSISPKQATEAVRTVMAQRKEGMNNFGEFESLFQPDAVDESKCSKCGYIIKFGVILYGINSYVRCNNCGKRTYQYSQHKEKSE